MLRSPCCPGSRNGGGLSPPFLLANSIVCTCTFLGEWRRLIAIEFVTRRKYFYSKAQVVAAQVPVDCCSYALRHLDSTTLWARHHFTAASIISLNQSQLAARILTIIFINHHTPIRELFSFDTVHSLDLSRQACLSRLFSVSVVTFSTHYAWAAFRLPPAPPLPTSTPAACQQWSLSRLRTLPCLPLPMPPQRVTSGSLRKEDPLPDLWVRSPLQVRT